MKHFNFTKLLLGGILLLSLSACNKDKKIAMPMSQISATELYAQLQEASKQGELKKVRALIKQGADVNQLVLDTEDNEYYQETPLMLASKQGHLAVVKELLAAGANVNQTLPIVTERCMIPGENFTALEMACRPDNMEVVKVLAQAGTRAQSIVICACLRRDEPLLKFALQQKPNLDFMTGDGGVSPLMMMASDGNENMVRALLEAGADPNYADPFEPNYTPLKAAKDYPEIVELLKSYGAKE